MAYRIEPTQSLGVELSRIVAEDLDEAAAALTGPGPIPEGIHTARKKLKRARAVVRLGRGVLDDEQARAEDTAYRDIGRMLSARRDADALVETADRLWAEAVVERPGAPTAILAALRDRLAIESNEFGDRADQIADALEALVEARRRVSSWPDGDPGWEGLAVGLGRQYRSGRRALRLAVADPTDENLHALRKRAKDHWYHLRLLRDLWPPAVRAAEKEAHRVADLLGDDHDLAVLRSHLRPPAEEIEDVIAARRAPLQEAAQGAAARLYVDRTGPWVRRLGIWWDQALFEGPPPERDGAEPAPSDQGEAAQAPATAVGGQVALGPSPR